MKDLTIKISWKVISDVDNILTVALFADDKLCHIAAGKKSEIMGKLEQF
jgi:hypothetical protein